MRLKDKVAVVTGGGRDIGRAVSVRLAAEGARVVVNYCNDGAGAERTLGEIQAGGGKAIVVQGDMTRAADVGRLFQEAAGAFGDRLDILVNNAGGIVARKPLDEMDEAFFDEVLALNLKSTFLTTKAAAGRMGPGSAIINLASQAGRDGGGGGACAYATAKGAVMTFTRSMAKELGPRGIRVNAVCPGMISTTFHDTFTKPEVRTAVAGSTPLRREGAAEEVAAAIAYLASDDAAFVHGVNLDINGGGYFS